MRNLMKRRRAQSFFVKLCLAVFAVGAIAAYGKLDVYKRQGVHPGQNAV